MISIVLIRPDPVPTHASRSFSIGLYHKTAFCFSTYSDPTEQYAASKLKEQILNTMEGFLEL